VGEKILQTMGKGNKQQTGIKEKWDRRGSLVLQYLGENQVGMPPFYPATLRWKRR